MTCPQHAPTYLERVQHGGSDAARHAHHAYNREADMVEYEEEEDLPNGDAPRHGLDRSGTAANSTGTTQAAFIF